MIERKTFNSVIIAGPDLKGHGGIAAVIASYMEHYGGLRYVPTNSRRGTAAGVMRLLGTMARLPLLRLPRHGKAPARILHLHGGTGKSFVRKMLLARWGKLLGYEVIYHMHPGVVEPYAQRIGREHFRRKLDHCHAIAVLSPTARSYYVNELGIDAAKVHIINNVVEQPADYTPLYDHGERPVEFLFMGMLVERKGIFDIIDAIERLAATHGGRFKVLVGGAHGEEERFRQLISLSPVAEHVEYLGWIDGDAKEAALRHADVMLLPSHAEGMPITIIEGFAHGKPAIATPVGGIPDLVNADNGTLVPVGKPEALAAAMARYIDAPALLEAQGRNALAAAARFTPAAVADSLEEMYRRL